MIAYVPLSLTKAAPERQKRQRVLCTPRSESSCMAASSIVYAYAALPITPSSAPIYLQLALSSHAFLYPPICTGSGLPSKQSLSHADGAICDEHVAAIVDWSPNLLYIAMKLLAGYRQVRTESELWMSGEDVLGRKDDTFVFVGGQR